MTDVRQGVGAFRIPRDVIAVHGPDATSFLQGQLSQDVEALADGRSAWSFVLHPDGKVAAWVRVTRLEPQRVLLDVDGGHGDDVVARLERFKLRIDCEIESFGWQTVALRGPGAPDVAPAGGSDLVVVDADWPGLAGVDLLGADVSIPEGVAELPLDVYDALRIEAGVPAMGAELDDGTIPAEAGVVERSVSFTKGCFTGQELVARIDSRGGNVPRRLRGLVVEGDALPPAGATLAVDGAEVGAVTSSARSASLGAPIALGYVRRSVEPPAAGEVTWDGGAAAVRVVELPLAS